MAGQINRVSSYAKNSTGRGFIAGTAPGLVTIDGVPAVARLLLLRRSVGRIVDARFSNPDGTYIFDFIAENEKFAVVALDINEVHNAVCADLITPVLMPEFGP